MDFSLPEAKGELVKWLSGDMQSGARSLIPDLASTEGFYVYGAGNVGRKIARALRLRKFNVRAFIDNNPDLHGKTVDGLSVLSPSNIVPQIRDVCVIAIWSYRHDPKLSQAHAKTIGFSTVVHFSALASFFALEEVLPNYAVSHPEVFCSEQMPERFERLLNLFEDPESRDILCRTMAFHFRPDPSVLPALRDGLPFEPSLISAYLDGGAYDGDDFSQKLKAFCGLQSAKLIEPDPANFERLQRRSFTNAFELTTVNVALSAKSGWVRFDNTGDWGAKVLEGASQDSGVNVRCATVDDLVDDWTGPIYVKMDLEGHEIPALMGSVKTLMRANSIFSVTIEHRPMDVFEIPEFLAQFPDRMLFIYTHDTEFRMDWVVYSVPKSLVIFH